MCCQREKSTSLGFKNKTQWVRRSRPLKLTTICVVILEWVSRQPYWVWTLLGFKLKSFRGILGNRRVKLSQLGNYANILVELNQCLNVVFNIHISEH